MTARTDYFAGFTASLFLLLMMYTPFIHAELYKWVDENGKVNYTQSPPPAGTPVTTIKPPSSISDSATVERLRRQQDVSGKLSAQRRSGIEQAGKEAGEKEEKQRLCAQARSAMASYDRPRVSVTSADGTRRALGEEERVQELEKARRQVEELCAG